MLAGDSRAVRRSAQRDLERATKKPKGRPQCHVRGIFIAPIHQTKEQGRALPGVDDQVFGDSRRLIPLPLVVQVPERRAGAQDLHDEVWHALDALGRQLRRIADDHQIGLVDAWLARQVEVDRRGQELAPAAAGLGFRFTQGIEDLCAQMHA